MVLSSSNGRSSRMVSRSRGIGEGFLLDSLPLSSLHLAPSKEKRTQGKKFSATNSVKEYHSSQPSKLFEREYQTLEIRGTENQEHIPLVQQVRRYLMKKVKVPFAHISSRVASIFKWKKKQSNA